jgi:hypothetical protein
LKELVDEDLAFVEEVERTTLLESTAMSSSFDRMRRSSKAIKLPLFFVNLCKAKTRESHVASLSPKQVGDGKENG